MAGRRATLPPEEREPFLQQVTGDLQGFVFPARYEFSRQTTAEQVVATMLHGFETNVFDHLQLEGQQMTLEQVVDFYCRTLLANPPGEAMRRALLDYLASDGGLDLRRPAAAREKLHGLLRLIVSTPEFQLS